MTKEQIRREQKELRNSLSPTEQATLSKAVRERLFQMEEFHVCRMVFVFLSFQSEIDTHEMIRAALACGKRVFVPKVEPLGMEFYEIDGFEGLIRSKFGILEPKSDEKVRYRGEMAEEQGAKGFVKMEKLMLLPGLAFDKKGNRIGYGAGYYDRYLTMHSATEFCKIALAYDFQVIESIPSDEYDVKADVILTPTRELRCSMS